jgi:hypothetical protein
MSDTTVTKPDTAHLREGARITLDELAVHLSALALRCRQLARAAEDPETRVELEPTIDSLDSHARGLQELGERMAHLARIVDGEVPLARTFKPGGDPWGAAALNSNREAYGGPAVIPTQWQLLHLAGHDGKEETTTYPEAMADVPRSILLSWESKAASDRRRRERDMAIAREARAIPCEKCGAKKGQACKTASGWEADAPHAARRREAEARVDARLGDIGDQPVAVAGA